ncbi:hypothetical protein DENSPDRAFT_847700 [Dentipellis sp. KUC8613]|nr:hypothetical protein DENSPDRAFT_847700 [Dentipellis sp. KUC8613]
MSSGHSSRSSSPASDRDSPATKKLPHTVHKIHVNSFDIHTPPFEVHVVADDKVLPEHLNWLIDTTDNSPRSVGIAPAYTKDSKVVNALAISTDTRILILTLTNLKAPRPRTNVAWVEGFRRHLNAHVLCNPHITIYAFDLGPLAMQLYHLHNLHVTEGVDIQSAFPLKTRSPSASIKFALGDTTKVHESNIDVTFRLMTFDPKKPAHLALRAWLANYVANLAVLEDTFYKAPRINTKKFTKEQLDFLSKTAYDSYQLDKMKSDTVDNEVTSRWDAKTKKLQVTSERYQSRVMGGSNQASRVQGRSAKLVTPSNLHGKTILSMSSGQRDLPTQAEAAQASILLHTLQGLRPMFDNPFLQTIWFNADSAVWPESFQVDIPDIPITPHPDYPINESQTQASEKMLSSSPDSRLCLVQGPPGTGKTTMITTTVLSSIAGGRGGIWLVAQSNVAVKNIAEKLVDMGFESWKLVVSKEFVLDWHEHLYRQNFRHIIRSDEFPKNPNLLQAMLSGAQVILCTLSMLSNDRLRSLGFFRFVPMHTLIIDEASQIKVGDYVPIISNNNTLRKICFIGDDKQLPPYGQEDIGDLESIFEIPHLREKAVFLDTQYSQEMHSGTSYINPKEIEAILLLAKHLQDEDKPYRIITPYDAQRDALEKALQQNGLSWQNKCFNVDAFQGNEDHYIIISLVRSRELGFLKNLRRTNVMLTRCKRGMFICSSKMFLKGKGAKCLAGAMAAHFGDEAWLTVEDIKGGNF